MADTSATHVGIYGKGKRILTVGDGNFSFSLGLASVLGSETAAESEHFLTATSYEAIESLEVAYPDALPNIRQLEFLGVKCFHGVDAANLVRFGPGVSDQKYDIVIWNFPCIADAKGADAQADLADANKALVQGFMQSAQSVLNPGGEIHITHKTKPPFAFWDLERWASDATPALSLTGSVVFDRVNYPMYINKKALTKDSFPCWDAEQYIFTRRAESDFVKDIGLACDSFTLRSDADASPMGPVPADLLAAAAAPKAVPSKKLLTFKSVEASGKGKAGKAGKAPTNKKKRKRRGAAATEVDSEDEGLFEWEAEAGSGVAGEDGEASTGVLPGWDALLVHGGARLVSVTVAMLKAVRILLIDRAKLINAHLSPEERDEMVSSLECERKKQLPTTWNRATSAANKANKKRKVEGAAIPSSSTNGFALLGGEDTSSSDDE